MTRTVQLKIYRYDPDKDAKPYMQDVTVELKDTDKMLLDALQRIKSDEILFSNVANYEENGFRFYTLASEGFVGDYYRVGNDVLHSDWQDSGAPGSPAILGYKGDASAFDLNRFLLTTNSANFYGNASGSERIYIHASPDGVSASFSMLLPVENWGFPGTEIFLGAQFKHIKAFWFTAESGVGFGIDDVVIDEPDGVGLPEPGSVGLLALALAGLRAATRRTATSGRPATAAGGN